MDGHIYGGILGIEHEIEDKVREKSSTSAAYGLTGQGQAVNSHRTTTEQWRTAEPIHIEYPLVGEETPQSALTSAN